MKPQVAIDCRMVGPVGHGIAKYVEELLCGLARLKITDYNIVCLINQEMPHPKKLQGFTAVQMRAPFLHPLELAEIPYVLVKSGIDLYHSPSFSSLVVCPCLHVVTIHDLNHLHYGGTLKKQYYRHVVKPFAATAKKLVTVSQTSRHEISQWLNREEASVEIAHNAITVPAAASISQTTLNKLEINKNKFFFCVSNPKPHKNLEFLSQVYKRFFDGAGKQVWPLVVTVDSSDLPSVCPGIKPVGGLKDFEVATLLGCAGAVLFPSLYEGFGRPPLEALARQTPALVSDIQVHREALSYAGIDLSEPRGFSFCSPTNEDAWLNALHAAMSGSLGPVSTETQRKILETYSVEALAKKMDHIYRSVLKLPT